MKTAKEIKARDIWNGQKTADLKQFIDAQAASLPGEEVIRHQMLAIRYRLEDYINSSAGDKKISVLDFVKMYLRVLNTTQKKLATLFEMQDSNLHKYLTGERKLSTVVVLKLSAFSHLDPEYWLRIEAKNELLEIRREKGATDSYAKYDYRHLLAKTG